MKIFAGVDISQNLEGEGFICNGCLRHHFAERVSFPTISRFIARSVAVLSQYTNASDKRILTPHNGNLTMFLADCSQLKKEALTLYSDSHLFTTFAMTVCNTVSPYW